MLTNLEKMIVVVFLLWVAAMVMLGMGITLIDFGPMTETQTHVLWLMLGFYWYETLARLIWGWGGMYHAKYDVVKSDEDSKILPLDIIRWCLGLRV